MTDAPFRLGENGLDLLNVEAKFHLLTMDRVGPKMMYLLTVANQVSHYLARLQMPKKKKFGATPPNFYPKWGWSNDELCIEDDSIGKPIEYCVKWLCDCLDADIWSS